MTLQRPIATSFNGGELSPRMGGRVDTAIYQVGLDTCENFAPSVEGAAVKRPGFEYITPAAPTAGWMTRFRFNLTQQYVLEWSDGKLRFFTNGVRIETSPGVPLEVAVPYTAAEARELSFQQSFDRLYLAHANHPPARLTRTGASTFTYEVITFANGPFADANIDRTKTVTTSGTIGSVTITAPIGIFSAGMVGSLFRIEAADFSTVTAWEAGSKDVAIGDKRRSDGKVYVAASAGTTGQVQPIHTEGTEWDGSNKKDINDNGPLGVQWTYLHDRFGVVRIDAVASANSATGTVIRRLPDSVTGTATFRWAAGAFSTTAGWPNAVVAFAGRLMWFKGFDLLASVAGDYLNHAAFTSSGVPTGDLAFRRTLATEDPVLWAIADRKIIVGTATRELAVGAINSASAISGDNIEAVPQSFYGSERVLPAQIGTAAIFVQRSGRKLRQATYDFGQDRYAAENMTVWCRHITADGIVQLAFQQEPEELLIGVRSDGQAIIHPHAPEQQIKGFARFVHSNGAGRFLSMTTIASDDGKSDELWALVERGGARSVERMAAWRDDADPREAAFFVDSGVTATAAAGQTHFSDLTHLAGQPVAVLADGGVVSGVVVAGDGTVTLPEGVVPTDRSYTITIGLPFTARMVTLRPELRTDQGTSQGVRQRLVKMALRLLGAAGLKIGAQGYQLDELIDRQGGNRMDAGIPLFDGDSERPVAGGWDRDGQGVIVSDAPLPAVIVAALPRISVQS